MNWQPHIWLLFPNILSYITCDQMFTKKIKPTFGALQYDDSVESIVSAEKIFCSLSLHY